MGERLVVTLNRNDEPLAAIYFHWSAYTIPATFILSEMSKYYLPQIIEADNNLTQLRLIRFAEKMYECGYCESEEFAKEQKLKDEIIDCAPEALQEVLNNIFRSHGGLAFADKELAKEKWPSEIFDDDGNRNQGIVAVSTDEIEAMKDCAQMLIEINLDDMRVLNGSIYAYTLEEYMDETVEDDDFIYPDDLPRSPIDLNEFNVDEIECAYDILSTAKNGWLRYGDTCYSIRYT